MKKYSAVGVASLLLAAAGRAGAQRTFTADPGAILAQARISASQMPDVPSAPAAKDAPKPPAGTRVPFGTVCRLGLNKADAVSRAMMALNEPFNPLTTGQSAWIGAKDAGQYVQAPYRVLGGATVDRISIVAEYNWMACIPVQGSMP